MLLLLTNRYSGYTVVSVFGSSIINLCLAVLIHRCVSRSTGVLGQFLNWKPIMLIGTLSYSLYLWQQLFLNRTSTAWATAFPVNLVFAICAAVASHFLLERPLLRMRHRLRPN